MHVQRLIQVNLERLGYVADRCATSYAAIDLIEASLAANDPYLLAVIERIEDGYRLLDWIRSNEATENMQVMMCGEPTRFDPPKGPQGPHWPDGVLSMPPILWPKWPK